MEMLKNISFKYKMIFGGIAAVLIPFLVAGIIIYVQLSRSLLEMAEEKSVHTVEDISRSISARLGQEIKLVSAIAAGPDITDASKTGDYRTAERELKAIHERIGERYFTILLADKSGTIRADAVFAQQIGVNILDRDYFQKAREGRASVAGPFLSRGPATPGEAIIVVCAPIELNGEFYGIVGLPFNIEFIMHIISRENSGQTGCAYLINSEGLVLVHPRKELNLQQRLLDLPHTEGIEEILLSKKSGTASYRFEGAEKIAGLAPVPLTAWTVVFAQSKDEIMSPVNGILSAIFISGIMFLFAIILIIIVFSSKVSTPVQKMTEMLKQLTRHSTEIILQIGLDRKILFANRAYEKIAGLREKNIIGTEPDLDNFNDIPAKVIWESLEKGIPWSGRITIKGGTQGTPEAVTLEVMLLPVRDDRGVVKGYLEIGRDVTAELRFEKRLQQSQKLEAIGTLAGGIAHDFNNILGGIFGYAELSLVNKTSVSETEKYTRQIIKASERARDLVSQILTFSRKTEVELKPLLPKTVIREALRLLRASTPAMIDIESKITGNSAIMADPTQMHQVIMNLFTNGVHAIGEKAGTIKLELNDFMVDEDFIRMHPGLRTGKHVIIRISDTGCGIDPENMDRLFEPFFTTKQQGEGTGLGLSVVHGIVKGLGGIVTAYSEIGKGTVFHVIIPCIETENSELDQKDSVIKRGTERIAFVDDEIAIAETMESLLENLGYKVTAFTDGMEALNAIKANPNDFDVLITDYSMPRITGLEITTNLNEAGITIPVILTSGYFGKDMESAARDAGISELITKPMNTYELAGVIRRALKKEKG